MKILRTEQELRDWLSQFDISHFQKVPEPEYPVIEVVDLMEEPDLIFIDEVENGVILDAGEKVFVPDNIHNNASYEFYVIALPSGDYINHLFENVDDAEKEIKKEYLFWSVEDEFSGPYFRASKAIWIENARKIGNSEFWAPIADWIIPIDAPGDIVFAASEEVIDFMHNNDIDFTIQEI